MSTEKPCGKCGAVKPLTDFFEDRRASDGRQRWCKKCQNAQPKKANTARMVRNRARHRAIAELTRRHEAEFDDLYEQYRAEAEREAAELASSPQAAEHYKAEPVRLRPGARQPGEKAGDRIDVARCPQCVRHHDRGHVCAKCGTAPVTPADVAGKRAEALRLYRAGTRIEVVAMTLHLPIQIVRQMIGVPA